MNCDALLEGEQYKGKKKDEACELMSVELLKKDGLTVEKDKWEVPDYSTGGTLNGQAAEDAAKKRPPMSDKTLYALYGRPGYMWERCPDPDERC